MPTVCFNLRNKTESNPLVYLVFRYDEKKFVYSTGQKIAPKFWNDDKQRAKETKQFAEYPEFNAYLSKLESEAQNIYRRYLNDGKPLDLETFKNEMEVVSGKRALGKISLFTFIENLIAERENTTQLSGKHFAKASIVVYRTSFNHLKKFAEKNRRKSLDFGDIDLEFYHDFTQFLFNPPNSFTVNNAGKIIKTLKTFLHEATERGFNDNHAFRSKKFKAMSEEVPNAYLTIEELTKLYLLDLSENKRLEKVRDLFLVGCFTGLRFSDFTTIRPEYIKTVDGVEIIYIQTQKTGQKVSIPLHPIVRAIFKRYEGVPPKAMSNQKLNKYLKELCQLAELVEPTILTFTKAGKRVQEVWRKSDLITTHTARRSFATNAFKMGVPSLSIMLITGHRTEKSFMRYIKIQREENAILMAQNPFFRGETSLVKTERSLVEEIIYSRN
ncbi:MAG: site-specific integrase [Saprospiraceae bacterium]